MAWVSMFLAIAAILVQGVDAPGRVWLDDELAVSYTARIEGDWLIVEANHEPGWHTYAMDNVIRARAKTGKSRPDTELPTRISLGNGGPDDLVWRQSPPLDLSDPEIRWYTWGFEDRSFFAAPVDVSRGPAPTSVQINAQACTDALCAMIDEMIVPVSATMAGDHRSVDPESLVVVARD